MTVKELKYYLKSYKDSDNIMIQRIEYEESFPDNIIAIRKKQDGDIILIGEQYRNESILWD